MCVRCQLSPIVNCEHCIQLQIERIINHSRHHEESFLIDSKTAANEILKFLQATDIKSSQLAAIS